MPTYTQYRDGSDTTSGPSPIIWADCPVLEIATDPSVGVHYFDDFLNYDSTATTVQNNSGTPVFEGACTVAGTAWAASDDSAGEIALFCTTDNEEAALQVGGVANAPYVISDTTADARKLWFECRVKKSTIADAIAGGFWGLAGPNSGVADFIADAGNDFADVDLIGFWNDETDDSVGSHVHFIYQNSGQAFVTKIDTAATMVADTYMKFGFVYDPLAADAEKIKIYVDGTASGTKVTATNIDTNTFPDAQALSPLIAIKAASATDCTFTMDWWRLAQLRP